MASPTSSIDEKKIEEIVQRVLERLGGVPPAGNQALTTSHARTTRSFSPSSVGSLRLATSVPMTLPRTMRYFEAFPARPSGSTASTLAWGRGITCTEITSPTRSAAR